MDFQKIGCAWAAVLVAAAAARGQPTPLYETDIRPILRVHCFHCHGDDGEKKSGLDLRLRRLMVQGGKSGPAIVPGQPQQSKLLELIQTGAMPDGGKPLARDEIQLIERWIAAGAPTATQEPDDPSAIPVVTEDDRQFWSFRPIVKPRLPSVGDAHMVRNSIDLFLLSRLEQNGLQFSPQADRRVLIRRAYFDLLGLPPDPGQVDAFLADPSPDAYERLIDRLLNSPAYGERWARHWLDVAGYADSEGYSPQDPVRPFAYFYRDYVIRSLNSDKPWDQMIVEQIAGDELVLPPRRPLTPEQQEMLAATGFLRMAQDGTASGVDPKIAANANIADTLQIVSTALLGLTVGCAQCHTHKYDPIPQTDYYRLRAILEPALNPAQWRKPEHRRISLYSDEDRAAASAIEAQAVKAEAQLKSRGEELVAQVLDREMAKVPQEKRDAVLQTRQTPAAQRTAEQQAIAKEFINAVNLSVHNLQLYDHALGQELESLRKRVAEIRASKPTELFVQVCDEPTDQPPPVTVVFHRGDPNQPREPVTPGVLSILEPYAPGPIPVDDPSSPFTGRRLAYAKHLTSGKHPLVARVLVNRFWMHHFGRGLVATPGDLGRAGEPPSHPELLDWLAADFMEHGWSLKRLHRLMMTSAAYQQSSARRRGAEVIDPDNRLLWRMPLRRLEAEALRDSVLVVTGDLLPKLYGSPVPVAQDQFGQVIPAIEVIDGNGIYQPNRELGGEQFRRSIYIQARRSRPLSMLEVFDLPNMEPNCERRTLSTVAPQSLLLMNAEFVTEASERFAARLERQAGADPAAQATLAWRLAFGRAPTESQLQSAVRFLTEQATLIAGAGSVDAPADVHQKREIESRHAALASFCQALLGSNEFLYVD